MNCYTAISIPAYRQLLASQHFKIQNLGDNLKGLYFSEDKAYWIERIREQADEAKLEDYAYALLIRFELLSDFIHELMSDELVGRLSPRMLEYHAALGKPSHIRPYHPKDEEVLCLLDVYECDETEDGISQAWMLQVPNESSAIWQVFQTSISKIECVGGIPGALDLV